MIDKCRFCKAAVSEERITIDYRWGDDLSVIQDIPAMVCQQCGEKYLTSRVYKEIEMIAKFGKKMINGGNDGIF